MHDLLKAYAAEKACDLDDDATRRAALTRLFDHYEAAATAAMDALFAAEGHARPQLASLVARRSPVPDTRAPQDWLDSERANMIAAIEYAAANGWPAHATRLAATMFRHVDVGGYEAAGS